MRRFLAVLLAVPFAVHATTTTYTSCTAGTITDTPCPGNLAVTVGLTNPPYNSYFVSAYAQASDTPQRHSSDFGFLSDSISTLAESTAFYTQCSMCPPEPPLSAQAQATVEDSYYTTGPSRTGFISIAELISSLHGSFFTEWTITDGPYTYGGGPYENQGCLPGPPIGDGCKGSATLPFELGIPFQVYVTTGPSGIAVSPPQSGAGAYNLVTLQFNLTESDGVSPAVFYPVPEPSSYGLLLSGLMAFSVWGVRRSSHKRRRSAA